MSTADDLRRIALLLEGTIETPHFDRTAFKVKRIYVTVAADHLSANFKFSPDEQAIKCTVAPHAFNPVPNAWGQQGWTAAILEELADDELAAVLRMAWQHARATKRTVQL